MKTKLLTSDKSRTASPLPRNRCAVSGVCGHRNGSPSSAAFMDVSPDFPSVSDLSPKVQSGVAHVRPGNSSSSSSPSSTGNGFITKEIFGTGVASKATPAKKRKEGKERASKSTSGDGQDLSRPDPFLSSTPVHLQSRGPSVASFSCCPFL